MIAKKFDLTAEQCYLAAFHALFDINDDTRKTMKALFLKISKTKAADYPRINNQLDVVHILKNDGYSWRDSSFVYTIIPQFIPELMEYLYKNHPDIVTQVLDAAKGSLKPSPVQRMVWSYIVNNHDTTCVNIAPDYEIEKDIEVFKLLPFFQDYGTLLSLLPPFTFTYTVSNALVNALENQDTLDIDYYSSLISAYSERHDAFLQYKRPLIYLLDLIAYLYEGRVPEQVSTSDKHHMLLAAIYNTAHGEYEKALDNFKHALHLHNTAGSSRKNAKYFPYSIVNYIYAIALLKVGSEDSNKKCAAIAKLNNNIQTLAVKCLYEIISNPVLTKDAKNKLEELANVDQNRIDQYLGFMLVRYIEEEKLADADYIHPEWAFMQHELNDYTTNDNPERKEKCSYAFGENPMLSAFPRKKLWESVLEELMGKRPANLSEKPVRKARNIFVLRDINSNFPNIRQQVRTKNGSWSAGKLLTQSDYIYNKGDVGDEIDFAIQRILKKEYNYYDIDFLDKILPLMLKDNRLYVGSAPYTQVELIEEEPYITLVKRRDGYTIKSNVKEEYIDNETIITHRGAASINFLRLKEEQRPIFRRLLMLKSFPLEAESMLRQFLQSLGGKVEVNSDLIEGGSTLPIIDGSSKIILQMRPNDRETYAASFFVRPLESGNIHVNPGKGDELIIDNGKWTDANGSVMEGRTRVKRDKKQERKNMKEMYAELGDDVTSALEQMKNGDTQIIESYELLPLLEYAQQHTDTIQCEWPEGASMRVKHRSSTQSWKGAIKKNENGWFQIEGSVEIDQGKVLTMAQLLEFASQSHGRYLKLGDGEFLALSERLNQQLKELSAIASHARGNKLVMSPFSAALLTPDTLDGELKFDEAQELKDIRQRIKDSSNYTPEVPKTLNATLRNYQVEGYHWMSRLNKWGAGALLADDMGLGKTIQTITFLLSKSEEGPSLVVAPASVAPNWKREIEKFAPSLNVSMLNFAANRREMIESQKTGDVLVTTYGLLLSVKDDITKKQWKTICLDEAHIIKNRGAKTSAVAMELKSDNRIMLTGTPVQNHLSELWNLFQFVNPGLLGSFEDFNRRFIIPIEQYHDKDMQYQLDRLVKPFMLRRTKSKVAKELPEKEEIYQHVSLSEEEKVIYEVVRQKAEALLMQEGNKSVSMTTLAEITRLRQCACDPRLIEEGKKGGANSSSKIDALVELVQTVLEGESNSGILVFSQFTSYLALIKNALDEAGVKYFYIDGSVPIKERERLVEEYQKPKKNTPAVFLISLKAGGLGLNLTRANYVVHMDPWWNPAIEAQATDRAHRIGQRQNVTVYHLISEGTIEEKIQRLHEQKRALVEDILQSTDVSHKLTGEELLQMVRG